MTTVLGIDPSLAATGYAFIESDGRISDLATIKTKPTTADIPARMARFNRILDAFGSAIDYADLVVIEGPSLGQKSQRGTHERAGLWWHLVSHVVTFQQIPIVEVPPTCRAMYATGRGNAGKDEVLAAVVRRYPDADVRDNNQADALVFAAMGARRLGAPLEESLPQTHLRALDKVGWPAGVPA